MMYTSVLADKKFEVLYAVRYASDSVRYFLKQFEVLDPSATANIIRETNTYPIPTYTDLNPRLFDTYRLGSVSFCAIQGFTYRIENNLVTDTLLYDIRQIEKVGNSLYGINHRVNYFKFNIIRPDGLVKSIDNGKTWQFVGNGASFTSSSLKIIEGEFFLVNGRWIAHLDWTSGEVRKLSIPSDSYIKDLTKHGNFVVVGTDAGVYYKNWDQFFD